MDALDTLSQIALAHGDQLALLEAVQQCSTSHQSADQDLLSIPDEDILNTPASLNTPGVLDTAVSMGHNFNFNTDSVMGTDGCRQPTQAGKNEHIFIFATLYFLLVLATSSEASDF